MRVPQYPGLPTSLQISLSFVSLHEILRVVEYAFTLYALLGPVAVAVSASTCYINCRRVVSEIEALAWHDSPPQPT